MGLTWFDLHSAHSTVRSKDHNLYPRQAGSHLVHLRRWGMQPGNLGTVSADLNRVIVHPDLRPTVEALRHAGVQLPRVPSPAGGGTESSIARGNAKVWPLEELVPSSLDAKRGRAVFEQGVPVYGYDESILNYGALEGLAQFTAHAVVLAKPTTYLPSVLLTAYFYTRSKAISRMHPILRLADDGDLAAEKNRVQDQMATLRQLVAPGSVLLVDGPLIAGDVYTTLLGLVEDLVNDETIAVFLVKNSTSTLMIDAVPDWEDSYNSDLHWAFRELEVGQRGPLFAYQDLRNPRNSKVFCYLKSLDTSPARAEVSLSTFEAFKDRMPALWDLIYYLYLAQGDRSNPQARPIAIAERYAREGLHVLDVQKLMRGAHLAPTMNQTRFGR